jgi:hypothetical protein
MSLASLLHEAFKLLELRFRAYDQDGASTLMYKELEHQLSLVGFCDQEKLEALFKRCSPPQALPYRSLQHACARQASETPALTSTPYAHRVCVRACACCVCVCVCVCVCLRQGGPRRKRDSGLQRVSLFALPVG